MMEIGKSYYINVICLIVVVLFVSISCIRDKNGESNEVNPHRMKLRVLLRFLLKDG